MLQGVVQYHPVGDDDDDLTKALSDFSGCSLSTDHICTYLFLEWKLLYYPLKLVRGRTVVNPKRGSVFMICISMH